MADGHDTVAILDAGAQYGKLIDRMVRELNVKTDLLPLNVDPDTVAAGGYKVTHHTISVSLLPPHLARHWQVARASTTAIT